MQKYARWRFVREIARVNVVEDGEVRWLWRAIDITFEYLRQRRAGSLETFLHLREDDLGLPLERQTFDLAGAGLEWRQARQEYKIAGEGDWIDRPFTSAFEIARVGFHPQSLHEASLPLVAPI